MTIVSLRRYLAVALPLLGSAILLYSCKAEQTTQEEQVNLETLMTEYSEDLSIQMSENGLKSYHFSTPLMEGYAMARDPYKEFRKGVKVVMYESDSTSNVSAILTSNYAIFYDNRKLWEAKGDVVVVQTNGRKLYTQQLFWNQATHRIYSNVDSRIIDGDEVYDCEGFESDENMKDWRYRKLKAVTYFSESEAAPADADATKSAAESGATKTLSNPSAAKESKSGDEAKKNQPENRPRRKLNNEGQLKISPKELDKKAMPMAKPTRDIEM